MCPSIFLRLESRFLLTFGFRLSFSLHLPYAVESPYIFLVSFLISPSISFFFARLEVFLESSSG